MQSNLFSDHLWSRCSAYAETGRPDFQEIGPKSEEASARLPKACLLDLLCRIFLHKSRTNKITIEKMECFCSTIGVFCSSVSTITENGRLQFSLVFSKKPRSKTVFDQN